MKQLERREGMKKTHTCGNQEILFLYARHNYRLIKVGEVCQNCGESVINLSTFSTQKEKGGNKD